MLPCVRLAHTSSVELRRYRPNDSEECRLESRCTTIYNVNARALGGVWLSEMAIGELRFHTSRSRGMARRPLGEKLV